MSDYQIIVSHPAQQHSYHLAAGVKKQGMLLRYLTAIYDKTGSFGMSAARLLVRGRDSSKLSNRRCPELDDGEVELYYTLPSLAVIILSRSLRTKPLSYRLDRWIANRFGRKVAKRAIRLHADAVICFLNNAESCFKYLQRHAPQITRVIDASSATVRYMARLYESDMELTGNPGLRREVPSFFEPATLQKEQRELDLTDVFLAPSRFAAESLSFCGVRREIIQLLPFGSNLPLCDKPRGVPDSIRFIYVGQISYRKGVHHLLRLFRELPWAELDLVGQTFSQDLPNDYRDCPNIHFHGHLPRERVQELLDQSQVMAFNSLSDSFSLSCLEAMSRGLPVIASTQAGVCDLIREGENGFTFAPADSEALRRHVCYFRDHPEEYPRFSAAAMETASCYTWSAYEDRLAVILAELRDQKHIQNRG
ncbi:MAG: glycosyltransferase family 4 protein [Oscillospiraceae bacterium]|nr:glycosyltransferase family 4 protein [Oscillospiraceae bacterium]MBQ6281117.1 glycosyltransferase family 4 protein [Oscillospiraceae bacterium]